jgi:threonine dehydrogenase-like Zn-dependent dehydrogenase
MESPSAVENASRVKTSRKTMRAAVIAAPRTLELREAPLPEPGPGQVRLRLEGCGVCASNIPVWEGRPWFEYPLEPGGSGHEGWGAVDALGEGVEGLQVGDRVAALSYHAYAEYDVADAGAVLKLSPELADTPFPAEPLGCAMNVFARGDIQPGHTVAIVGVGFLGALLTRLATGAGARVIALSRRDTALETARRFGAETMLSLRDADRASIVEQVFQLTAGQGCDRVIEAVGSQEPLTLAGELVRVRGKLVIAGYHQDGLREVNLQQWNWRGIDVINAHERDPQVYLDGMTRAGRAVARGELDPTPLYTHVFPLEQLDRALDHARERPTGFMKALVLCQ